MILRADNLADWLSANPAAHLQVNVGRQWAGYLPLNRNNSRMTASSSGESELPTRSGRLRC